jgi:serine/threonine protein kinase
MNSRQHEESLFEAARQLVNAAARRAFLDQACSGQPELLQRLELLLSAEADADKFFKVPALVPGELAKRLAAGNDELLVAPGLADSSTLAEGLGTRIGNYKLLQKIGEGGCGGVYMAEQEKPIRRRVALKIIKLGMDTKSVIARFEAERQALAMMDHPNIARVLDAGATETGRPFFVMELVRGIKVTDFCDENHLNTRQRLNLFIQICTAIQHAHQKGIIHRDIKPSNILVTLHDGVPVPKVIDFGIAKAIEVRLTDKTLFTAYEQMIGTPAYMSPEQAEMSGLDVDTRSDIYSLGVLLYELLTGRPPFDPKKLVQDGLDEMRRTLREREPQRPSTMVTTLQGEELTAVTEQHDAELPKLISILRGDLDWIVMKSLEKDRKRRYETANGLAMDIERYLNNEPVVARPPSRLYRFEKLVRRNRVVFAAAAAVAAALCIGLGVSTWLFLRERDARQRAVDAEQKEIELRQQAELREKITQITLLVNQENFQEADALLEKISFTQPTVEGAGVLRSLGEWQACRGVWKTAAEHFTKLLEVDQLDSWDVVTLDWLECGPALLETGDLEGYEHFRQAAVARFAGTTYPVADRILKISLLLPASQKLIDSLVPLAGVTEQTFNATVGGAKEDSFRAAWQCVSLALMEYRSGHYAKAADWAQRGLAFPEFNASRVATSHVILALAWQQLGKTEPARAELTLGREAIEGKFRAGLDRGSALHGFWFDWVFAQILLREAENLIPPAEIPAAK